MPRNELEVAEAVLWLVDEAAGGAPLWHDRLLMYSGRAPAWREVSISPFAESHLQATGRDARGRKQDPRFATEVKCYRDLPGRDLFHYLDEGGERHRISSSDVNAYLRKASGGDFTAEDFRTWAEPLRRRARCPASHRSITGHMQKNIVQVVESVAKRLGNTPTVVSLIFIPRYSRHTPMERRSATVRCGAENR